MEKKLYLKIAGDLEQQIRDGRLKVNQKLSSERIMAEHYGVSRSVIREALRVLNEKGLVEIRNCSGGYVKRPDTQNLIQKFEDAVDLSFVNSDELLEARYLIEAVIGKLVVERITEGNLRKLKEIYIEMELEKKNVEKYSVLDAEFHYQLSAASANKVMMLVTTSLNKLTNRSQYLDNRSDSSIREHAQQEHKEMILAIENHDLKAFELAVQRHIECIRKSLNLSFENND